MDQDHATTVRLPLLRLGAALVGVCVAAAGIGAAIGTTRSGAADAVLTLGATLPGVAVSMLLLATRPARPAATWAVPVLAGTMVRALATLLIAGGMVAAMTLDKSLFMLTVLGALLACLAIEVGVTLRTVNTRDAHRQASLEGARP